MAILGVDDFKSKLVGGGARSNLFKVTMNFPGYANGDVELTSFMCKTAQFPSSVVASITVPFRGRQLQLAGDRTFEPWTVTIINDTGFEVRNAFEAWSNGINGHNSNTGLSNPTDYQADAVIEQLDKEGNVTKTLEGFGLPTSVLSTFHMKLQIQFKSLLLNYKYSIGNQLEPHLN